MGITVGFLVKHVRPFGAGFNAYCSQDLIGVLFSLNFTAAEVIGILADWYQVSQANPMGQSNRFVAAAKAVAKARWAELYPTDMSTVMFLDHTQLAALSQAGERAVVLRQGEFLEPLFSIIPCTLQADLERAWQAGERSPQRWLRSLVPLTVDCLPGDPRLANLNTPELLAAAQQLPSGNLTGKNSSHAG